MKKLQLLLQKKSIPFFPATPSQNWEPAKTPPFRKFGRSLNPPPSQQKVGGAHYVNKDKIYFIKNTFYPN